MSFEIGLFAHETTDMSLPIEICQWCVSLSLLEADSAEHETHHELFVYTVIRIVRAVCHSIAVFPMFCI